MYSREILSRDFLDRSPTVCDVLGSEKNDPIPDMVRQETSITKLQQVRNNIMAPSHHKKRISDADILDTEAVISTTSF